MAITRRTMAGYALGAAGLMAIPTGLARANTAAQGAATGGVAPHRRVIIDTDTATDDALAILMALKAPNLKVEALTMVVGNVDFQQETRNALYTLQAGGYSGQYPVFQGMARPMIRQDKYVPATWVHGMDGMSDANFPVPKQKPESEHGVQTIIRLARQYPGEITIAAIGPLTNVAMAMLLEPELPKLLKEVVFMGGYRNFHGTVTPVGTYNIWVDPEAARVVFESGVKLTTVGFDVSVESSVMNDDDYARVEGMNTPLSDFFLKINKIRRVYCKEHQQMAGSNHPDTITMAYLVNPAISLGMVERYCEIDVSDGLGCGQMFVDELGMLKKPANVSICTKADEALFKRMMFDMLA